MGTGQPADRPHLLQPAGAAGRGELPAAGARPAHRGARGQRGLSHHVIFCTIWISTAPTIVLPPFVFQKNV